jgi:hypothetical protein
METAGGPTDRQTDRQTAAKQYALPSSKGGINISFMHYTTIWQFLSRLSPNFTDNPRKNKS